MAQKSNVVLQLQGEIKQLKAALKEANALAAKHNQELKAANEKIQFQEKRVQVMANTIVRRSSQEFSTAMQKVSILNSFEELNTATKALEGVLIIHQNAFKKMARVMSLVKSSTNDEQLYTATETLKGAGCCAGNHNKVKGGENDSRNNG